MARARLVRFASSHREMLLAVVGLLLISGAITRGDGAPEGLKRLDFLLNEWRGTSSGEPGNGTVERSCAKALNDRLIECRTTTTYPPEEKNKKGDTHGTERIAPSSARSIPMAVVPTSKSIPDTPSADSTVVKYSTTIGGPSSTMRDARERRMLDVVRPAVVDIEVPSRT